MTADLKSTLAELGPGYPEMVARMRSAFAEPSPSPRRRVAVRLPLAAAASLLVALGLAAALLRDFAPRAENAGRVPIYELRGVSASNRYALAHVGTEAAFREILRTQEADGGWGNRFLTQQNVAALQHFNDPAAKLAVRRGLRNLRFTEMH